MRRVGSRGGGVGKEVMVEVVKHRMLLYIYFVKAASIKMN